MLPGAGILGWADGKFVAEIVVGDMAIVGLAVADNDAVGTGVFDNCNVGASVAVGVNVTVVNGLVGSTDGSVN